VIKRWWPLLLIAGVLLMLWGGWRIVQRYQGRLSSPGIAPTPLAESESLAVAGRFDFPLDVERFGPYIAQTRKGVLIDTRYGVQNPGLGRDGKCFVALSGEHVPFSDLYHAGEDWFVLNAKGNVVPGQSAGTPVRAVADGVIRWVQLKGFDGYVVIVEHLLPEERVVWSVYWHLADVQVAQGEAVALGQTLAHIHDRGLNSHLHWEIRTFFAGDDLFSADSAGGRGTCNGHVTAVGYTWDDDPLRAQPGYWGYVDPVAFVRELQ
jgi:murein DD-endopeptidase MepM/ murein hydrolase activator NlpD